MSKDFGADFESADSIAEQASGWWITLNAGAPTASETKAFAEWAGRSSERIEAFLETARLTRVLASKQLRWPDTPVTELARGMQGGAEVVSLRDGSRPKRPEASVVRRGIAMATAAALVATVVGLQFWSGRSHQYETLRGEQRSVTLEDGSIVTLNTTSRMEVRYEKEHRLIQLEEGEALFQVAREASRPFEVIVGNMRVRAVGTQFNVDRRRGRTVVTVVEGKVAVVQSGQTRYLEAGERLAVGTAAAVEKAVDVQAATAWTQRRLVFDHRPIGEVAEEFNRYNRLQIDIQSPKLRAEKMTAVFQANDPQSFVDFVAKMPDVRVERKADRVKISGGQIF